MTDKREMTREELLRQFIAFNKLVHDRFAIDAAQHEQTERKLMAAFPTAQSYVCEDPDKFGAGMVVVEDGSTRRMMITKTICGFVETIWNERRVGRSVMCRNIFHGSVLTLDANQNWTPYA